MTTSTSYFPRNPKFTDAFERQLANDDAAHLARNEPSLFAPAIKRIAQVLTAVARATGFFRAA